MLKGWRKYAGCLLAAVGIIATACLAGCAEVTSASPHRASGLVAENMQLPAQFKRADGSVETIMLDAQVIRPDDDLPHPLLVFNHDYYSDPGEIYADFMRALTIQYARYGLTTLAFTRRGVGLSEGKMTAGVDFCRAPEILRFEGENAEDILEAIRLISQKPYVDRSKIINVGFYTGGFQAIALARHQPGLLFAAINVDGIVRKTSASRVCARKPLVGAIEKMGQIPRIPTLWLYSASLVDAERKGRAMVDAYIKNGGEADLFHLPAITWNDIFPFESESSLWSKYIHPFLRKIGVQTLDEPISVKRIRAINGFGKDG